MWEWGTEAGAAAFFLILGALGFLFLLVSFFFSETLEAFELEDASDVSGEPGVISLRTVSVFLTGLGGLGAIGRLQGASVLVSAAVGLMGGLVLAGTVYAFARYLYQQQSSSLVLTEDLVGRRAEVIVKIPDGGLGQICCHLGETRIEKIARSRNGHAIPANSAVRIEEASGETIIVSVWQRDDLARGLFSFSEAGDESTRR